MATGKEQTNSRWLYKTLETIGVSEKHRKQLKRTGIKLEILHTIRRKGTFSVYIFGSSCEGTTTPGMKSDLDVVACSESCPVIEHLRTDYNKGWTSVMVTDPETAVGYVKLQVVKDGLPLTSRDWENMPSNQRELFQVDIHGRPVWKNSKISSCDELYFATYRNGPAITMVHSATDTVFAYRCRSWPSLADEWISRVRHYGWPGTTVIERLKTFGCFLVGVGHPNSTEKDIEWRISFSLQERELMFGLNDVQYKCYVLLKLIKRDLITAVIGDSLSSYHCKTCLFYTIERNPLDIWRPANLVRCAIQCLQLLLEWTNNNYCPNYFVPGENMYDGRIVGCVQDNVSRVLNDLLSEGSGLFNRIKTDNVGIFLLNRGSSFILKLLEEKSKTRLEELMGYVQIATVDVTLLTVMKLLQDILTGERGQRNIKRHSPDDILVAITRLRELIIWLFSIDSATEHTSEDTQDAIDLLLPFFHTCLASHLAAFAMVCNNTKLRKEFIEESVWHYQHGMSSDLASGRLKYLTFLYVDGQYSECDEQLKSLEKEFKPNVISVSRGRDRPKHNVLPRFLANCDLRTRDIFQKYTSSSVIFLPTETDLIPQALQFEMFRSFGTPDSSREVNNDYWYDWVVVDGKVYLYFLWYILAVKMNKPIPVRIAIFEKLQSSAVDFLIHRETAFNLIAWVAAKEGFMLQAFKFLIASWKCVQKLDIFYHKGLQKSLQAYHNAAKWHMLLLLMNIWQPKPHFTQGDAANVRFCFECFQEELDRFKICNKCKIAQYCSKTCQIKNKKIHEKICHLFQGSAVKKV